MTQIQYLIVAWKNKTNFFLFKWYYTNQQTHTQFILNTLIKVGFKSVKC